VKTRLLAVLWFAAWVVMLPLVHSHFAAASDILGVDARGVIHTIFATDLEDHIDFSQQARIHTVQFSSPEIAFSVITDKFSFQKTVAARIEPIVDLAGRPSWRIDVSIDVQPDSCLVGVAPPRAPPVVSV
jgi:hypothetical protein